MDVPTEVKDRLEINVAGEFALKVPAADLVRLVQMRRAAREMTEHSKQLAKSTEELKQLAAKRSKLEAVAREQWGKRTEAKWKGSKKAWQAAKKKAAEELAENKRLSKKLTEEIATSKKGLKVAQKTWQAARHGLKTVVGRSIAEGLEKATKKVLQKVLGKLIPGLNLITTAIDLYEVGSMLWKWANGAEIEFGLGEDGDGKGGANTGDGCRPGEDGGDHGDGGTGDGEGGNAKMPDDAGMDAGDPARPAPPLHAGAQAVLDLLRSDQGVAFSPDDLENLNVMIPADVSGEELAELKKRLAAGTIPLTDPFEIIGTVRDQIDRIRNGDHRPLVTVDGVDTTDAAIAVASKTPASGETVAPPEPTPEPPASGDGTEAKDKTGPSEMLPDAATRGTVDFDPKKKQWVISPERKAVIDKQVYIHADGTEVKISNAKITNKQIQRGKQKLYFATFSYTGTVVAIPSSAGADYPFKVGQTKEYTHNVWHDGTSAGTVTYDSNPFLAALNLENGRWTANTGATINLSDATLVAKVVTAQERTDAGWSVAVEFHVQTAAKYSTVMIGSKTIPLVVGQDVVIGPVSIPDAENADAK